MIFLLASQERPSFRGQVNEQVNLQHFGNQLFAALFQGAVGNSLVRSLDAAEREGKGLRLRLRLNDVPELATLPWEYLHNPTDERFLGLSGQTPIVRYLELAATEQPLELVRPLRILMVIANPINFPPLNVEYEWKKVQDALFDLQDRGLIEIERLPHATLAQLQNQLREGEYHILHFIGAEEQARARKRSNQFVMGLTIFLILTVGLAIFGFYSATQASHHAQEAQRNAEEAQENEQKAQKESRISLAKLLVGQVPYILETTNDSGLGTLLSLESLYLNQQLEGDVQELLGFSLLEVRPPI